MKYYLKQTLALLRQNPLLSVISILGTAFAITMIMVVVITWQTKYADLSPEVNRSRCLYLSGMHIYGKKNSMQHSYNRLSPAFMKTFIQPIPEVEACTAYNASDVAMVSLTDGSRRLKADAMDTDPGFWQIFEMSFLSGRPLADADRAGKSKAIVICASVARHLFGTTDAAGQELLLNREPARVVGVVRDVSVTAKDAYAQVWGLYPADLLQVNGIWSHMDDYQIAVLARSTDDFPAIGQALKKRVETYNAAEDEFQLDIMEQPDNIVAHVNHVWSNKGPDLTMLYLQYGIALLVILLVPSLNLSGLSTSRMQQRMSELGVRKAFGATRGVLMRQILNENLMLTLLGGVLGLLMSYVSVWILRERLFINAQNVGTAGDFSLSMEALFSPTVFALSFIFCVIINVLSAALPAWMATKRPIVEALNDK